MRLLPFFTLLTILAGCSPAVGNEDHENLRSEGTASPSAPINSLSLIELIDSLYSDTLLHRDPFDTGKVDTFYRGHIEALVSRIRNDHDDPKQQFPCVGWDRITGADAWVSWDNNGQHRTVYGPSQSLSADQRERLLRLVNDPRNFTWAECGTWSPTCRFTFHLANGTVRTLDIGCSYQLRTEFNKIKFGTLSKPGRATLDQLCRELGLKNQ